MFESLDRIMRENWLSFLLMGLFLLMIVLFSIVQDASAKNFCAGMIIVFGIAAIPAWGKFSPKEKKDENLESF